MLHAHSLGDLDAVHLEDVLFARARLNEAVIAVGTDIGLLARVDLENIHQSSPKSFNDLDYHLCTRKQCKINAGGGG